MVAMLGVVTIQTVAIQSHWVPISPVLKRAAKVKSWKEPVVKGSFFSAAADIPIATKSHGIGRCFIHANADSIS